MSAQMHVAIENALASIFKKPHLHAFQVNIAYIDQVILAGLCMHSLNRKSTFNSPKCVAVPLFIQKHFLLSAKRLGNPNPPTTNKYTHSSPDLHHPFL